MAKKRKPEKKEKSQKIVPIDCIPEYSQQPRSSPPKRRTDFSVFMCSSPNSGCFISASVSVFNSSITFYAFHRFMFTNCLINDYSYCFFELPKLISVAFVLIVNSIMLTLYGFIVINSIDDWFYFYWDKSWTSVSFVVY